MACRLPEEEDEAADGKCSADCEGDRVTAPCVACGSFLDRRQHGTGERDRRAGKGEDGRAFTRSQREPEWDDGAAGRDRRDDAHRPSRQRGVEAGEPGTTADPSDHADPESTRVDMAVGGQHCKEHREAGCL